MFKKSLFALLFCYAASACALSFHSQHALVYEEESGKVLLEKDADAVVSIASLTKLMTAMVILDAKQDMDELVDIDDSDVDRFKHSSSRVPVGVLLPRSVVLNLALMSSDNRAASALARTYPGGRAAFLTAVQKKLQALKMHHTVIEEPTGLSPNNRANAADLVKMTTAASRYPEIVQLSTNISELIDMNGHPVQFRNTNRLVGKKDWDIQVSKTGFTREAGRCLAMRMKAAGKHVVVVLLNAQDSVARLIDAENVQRYLEGKLTPVLAVAPKIKRKVRTAVAASKRKGHNAVASSKRHHKNRRV